MDFTEIDSKSLLAVFSVFAVMLGWLVNSYLNRRHEIFKRRMDLRFEMYSSCTVTAVALEELWQAGSKGKVNVDPLVSEFLKKLVECQPMVLMYGETNEIKNIIAVVEFAKNNAHLQMKNEMAQLMRSVRTSLRKDLGLSQISDNELD